MTDSDTQSTQSQESQTDPRERRIVPRTEVSAPISYQIVSGQSDELFEGKLADLSIAGAAFVTENELPLQTVVRLHVPSPKGQGAGEVRLIKGFIVNRSQLADLSWRYGVKFEKLFYTLAGLVTALAAQHSSESPKGTFDI